MIILINALPLFEVYKFYNVDLNYRRGLIMGISITIDSKYVELKNRLIGHKSISFKEQYKVVWRLYNGLTCKIDYIAFKKLKYGYSSYIKIYLWWRVKAVSLNK